MTEHHLVQARLAGADAAELDADREVLGLRTRSDAVRAGLRLLHREARYARLARDYDEFYGAGREAPLSELAAMGDEIAADVPR